MSNTMKSTEATNMRSIIDADECQEIKLQQVIYSEKMHRKEKPLADIIVCM